MRNSKASAKELYEQWKTLKRQLDTLEQDKIQPFIVDLYKTLPAEWREILVRDNVLTRVFAHGRAQMILVVGFRNNFETKEEALQKCGELRTLLSKHMGVAIEQIEEGLGLIKLTFFLDPSVV